MRRIPVAKGKYWALVDDEDFEKVSKYKWYARPVNTKIYAASDIKVEGKVLRISMHRFILETPKGVYVDHIDGDTLNNCRSNLRECTQSQNMANMGLTTRNKSGYKGVYYYRGWRSSVRFRNRTIHLGVFPTPLAAAKAYNKKIQELWGEFAKSNRL